MPVTLDTQELAQQLQETTIQDAASKENADAPKEPSPIDDAHRVYVGNLSYTMTEGELKDLFAQAGTIASVNIVSRRNYRTKSQNPTGIAFVGYTNDEDAQKAIDSFDGKQVGERLLKVKLARPLSEREPRTPRQSKAKNGSKSAAENGAEGLDTTTESATTPSKKKKRNSKSKAKKSVAEDGSGEVVETTEAAKDGDDAALRNEKRKARMEEKRAQRQTAGIPSETKLFVYGLGSDATKEGLLELFKDYKPTEAKIAQRQLPAWLRKKKAQLAQVPGGRGFGFVTFANKEDQQAALKALDGASYGKRELSVKVAMDLPSTTDSDGNATPDGTVPDGNKAEKQESSPAETPTAK